MREETAAESQVCFLVCKTCRKGNRPEKEGQSDEEQD